MTSSGSESTAGAKRPGFASAYPESEAIDQLLFAFEAGNFSAVRTGTTELLATTDDEAIRDAARDLRRRIHPGATAVYILALSIGLLIVLAAYYWLDSPA